MCFRPAGVNKPQECPKCQKKVAAVGGALPKTCPFCKTTFCGDGVPVAAEADED